MPVTQQGSRAIGAALGLTFFSSAALAHHAGGAANALGAGPINTISATTLEQGHNVAGITVLYTSYENLSDATLIEAAEAGIEDVHGLGSIQNYGLTYSYGLTDDLMVSLWLPYVRRTGIREVPHEHGEEDHHDEDHEHLEVESLGSPSGIGDLSLLGQYRFYDDRPSRTEAALLLGFQAPTGVTDETSHGELLEAEFQPGSGSWDGLFGVALTHRAGRWSYDGNVLYMLVTEGTQDTDLGDVFFYNAAISYRLTSLSGTVPMFHGANSHEEGDDGHHHTHGGAGAHEHTEEAGPALDLVLEVNGEWDAKQETAGVTDPNSGGHTIYIAPGLRYSYDQWSSYVSVGIPVLTDFNGIQAEPDWRISAGSSLAF